MECKREPVVCEGMYTMAVMKNDLIVSMLAGSSPRCAGSSSKKD